MQLDKDAANRFIKAALAEATRNGEKELKRLGIDGPTNSSHATWQPRARGIEEEPPQPEGGIHTRFAQLSGNKESSSSASSSSISGDELPPIKKVWTEEEKKRKRPVLDPFTGKSHETVCAYVSYGDYKVTASLVARRPKVPELTILLPLPMRAPKYWIQHSQPRRHPTLALQIQFRLRHQVRQKMRARKPRRKLECRRLRAARKHRSPLLS